MPTLFALGKDLLPLFINLMWLRVFHTKQDFCPLEIYYYYYFTSTPPFLPLHCNSISRFFKSVKHKIGDWFLTFYAGCSEVINFFQNDLGGLPSDMNHILRIVQRCKAFTDGTYCSRLTEYFL